VRVAENNARRMALICATAIVTPIRSVDMASEGSADAAHPPDARNARRPFQLGPRGQRVGFATAHPSPAVFVLCLRFDAPLCRKPIAVSLVHAAPDSVSVITEEGRSHAG
jgi:hypothetical protein